ncbi:hypothetical protein AQI88_20715 [Streptomyces cellostaticus]|uniref:DUF1707 domain-containing protein n=1 Tax=Streptomyces cellostaticus TaxID=67285 RepID=A0A101NKE7_9ACTN|nr:DUF1707 domain-containing protein [Streptomyces cellostaticus]KUM94604.1 hypothetical protein AQI88_20715 [Streptomyces cellostaticus]GHI07369.1 hypothetical protein Scel_56900 [Streptomyces cellostaticus]
MTDDASPDLRASDADRERVAEVLRDAVAEGRLDMEEFEERLEAVYKARTYGELTPITRDLPAAGAATPTPVSFVKASAESGGWASRVVGGEGSSSGGIAILSGFERKGRWTVPKRFSCFAFMGGGEIDLREANFADHEVEINCVAVMGGVQVVVPPGVEVVVRGIGIMGGFEHPRDDGPAEPGAPRVIIGGIAFWGGVGVERKVTRAEQKRLKEQRRQEKLEHRRSRHELRQAVREDGHELHRAQLEEWHELHRQRREERRERRRGRRY